MRAIPCSFILSGAVLMSFTACNRHGAPDVAVDDAAVTVRSEIVRSGAEQRVQLVAGTVRPVDHAVVAARVMGSVVAADFAVGQRVAAGDVLVVLSADEIAARLAQAQAALDAVVRDHAREAALLEQGAATTDSVRSLADRLRGAEAAVKEAKTLQSYTRVAAPFAGVIAEKRVQRGDLAAPGAPLFTLDGVVGLRAEVEVPASLPAPALGASLPVEVSGLTVFGTLDELAVSADPQTRTRLAKILLSAGIAGVQSGDFARVAWPAGESVVITVPAGAVSLFGQIERVFVLKEGRAQLRLVKTAGVLPDGRVRIAAGLEAGESVILAEEGTALHDGQRVEVRP